HIVIERYCCLRGEIVRHGLKQPLGVRFIGMTRRYVRGPRHPYHSKNSCPFHYACCDLRNRMPHTLLRYLAEWDRWNPAIDLVLFLGTRPAFSWRSQYSGCSDKFGGSGNAVDHTVDRHSQDFSWSWSSLPVCCATVNRIAFSNRLKTVLRKWCI